MKYFYMLGKLPSDTIEKLRNEVLKKHNPDKGYQWIEVDDHLNSMWNSIWENTDLKVRKWDNKWIQKAFYSPVGKGWKIHKDGIDCKVALNIALQSNPGDWVRWYDEEHINKLASIKVNTNSQGKGSSRNIEIDDYQNVDFVQELSVQEGDVYLVNTDVFHSFYCDGPKDRIILQTKFEKNPSFDYVLESVKNNNFSIIESY